jgi:hypothetical protein
MAIGAIGLLTMMHSTNVCVVDVIIITNMHITVLETIPIKTILITQENVLLVGTLRPELTLFQQKITETGLMLTLIHMRQCVRFVDTISQDRTIQAGHGESTTKHYTKDGVMLVMDGKKKTTIWCLQVPPVQAHVLTHQKQDMTVLSVNITKYINLLLDTHGLVIQCWIPLITKEVVQDVV